MNKILEQSRMEVKLINLGVRRRRNEQYEAPTNLISTKSQRLNVRNATPRSNRNP